MIYFNAKYENQKITGVQRVAKNICANLTPQLEIKLLSNPYVGMKGHLFEQIILPFKMRKNTLLLSPTNTGPIIHKNQIVIIHDMATFDNPSWFSKTFSATYRILLPVLAKRVRMVVTVSEYSKARIVKLLKIPASKVKVIKNGVEKCFFEPINTELFTKIVTKFGLNDKKYILSVSSIEPRKNLPKLIEAWLASELPKNGYKLALAGGKSKSFSSVSEYNHPSIIWLGYVEDELLPELYKNAAGFAYLSLYEGFGLPLLEAMASGVPVLASSTTAIPEVVADCGILVEPTDIPSIVDGFNQLLDLPQEKIIQAKLRAAEFTWENTGKQMYQIIKDLEECL
jgi:glycosyltransferase involved in cell wall biosynthesis